MQFEIRCECRHKLVVTAGDAGSTLRCKCGRTIQVPGLHELRASAPTPVPTVAAPTRDPPPVRIIGVVLVIVAFIWLCFFRPLPGMTGTQATLGLLTGTLGGFALYSTGVILWAIGKGYRPLYGLLLVFLGPLGLIALLAFPSRER